MVDAMVEVLNVDVASEVWALGLIVYIFLLFE